MQKRYSTKYIEYTVGNLIIDFKSYNRDKEIDDWNYWASSGCYF